MATTLVSTSKSVKTVGGNSGYTFYMEVIMNWYDSAANYWNVTINHYGKGTGGYDYNSHPQPKSTIQETIDGITSTLKTTSVTAIGSSKKKIGTWTGNIYANADGNKYVTFICKYAPGASNSYLPKANTITAGVQMPTIPRYAAITNFSVAKKDETSVTVNWGTDSAVNGIWYSTNNGSSWVGTSGNPFTISGLSAGTTYNFKIRVRRTDSGLTTDSGTYTQSTYSYPYVSSMPNFTIGNQLSLGLYNPLGRELKVYLINAANTSETNGNTTSGTSITGYTNATYQTLLYNGIPNSASGTYKVRLVCSALSRDTTVTGGTYSVNANTNKPNVDNCAGTYVANLTELTNNNQTVINGASTITYTITSGATALNGASISEYIVNWGNISGTITNIANPTSLVKGSGNTISVTVKDSRGLTNTFSTPITEVVDYTLPTGLAMSADRLNGVGENVYLDVSGTMYYDKFGTNGVSNNITDIKYSVVNETAQNISVSLSSLAYSQQSAETHTKRFSIVDAPISIDGQGGGFDTTKTYTVNVVVYDTSGNSVSISGTIKDGKFAMIKGRDSNGDYHTGINGLPDDDYALKVHGNISADNIYNPYPVGSIYLSAIDTSPASIYGGTWTKIKGRYLYAINADTGTAGKDNMSTYTGAGSQSVTLTNGQLPKLEGYFATTVPANHNNYATGVFSGSSTTWSGKTLVATEASNTYMWGYNFNAGNNEGHAHGISYVTLHVWQRTA